MTTELRELIDGRWLGYLAIPAAWTVFFSLFNTPGSGHHMEPLRSIGWRRRRSQRNVALSRLPDLQ